MKRIASHLEDIGYIRRDHPCHYSHYFTSRNRGIVIDSMKIRSYRLLLGVDCIPADHPRTASTTDGQIDAESPWFNYRTTDDKENAITSCIDWIDKVAIPFLAAPFSKELHRWTTEDSILIFNKGILIPIPKIRKLP